MFTKRKRQIFYLIERGLSSNEIGKELKISPITVDNHVAQMRKQVGAKNRQQLVSIVLRSGMKIFNKIST